MREAKFFRQKRDGTPDVLRALPVEQHATRGVKQAGVFRGQERRSPGRSWSCPKMWLCCPRGSVSSSMG
jgi:hypothetical protein